MVEAGSVLGRKWLSVITYFQPLRLSDFDISTALHLRTLTVPPGHACRHCGNAAHLGHDEVCTKRSRWTIMRHDSIVRALEGGLSTLDSTRIEVEPSTLEGRRRNDIRVHGSAATRRTTIDYDIKVVSLMSHHAHSTTTRIPTGTSTFEHAQSQANRYLESVGKAADIRRPWALSEFRALVFSAGGLMEKETAAELDRWKPDLGEATFDRMMTRMSLALLRARAKTFEL